MATGLHSYGCIGASTRAPSLQARTQLQSPAIQSVVSQKTAKTLCRSAATSSSAISPKDSSSKSAIEYIDLHHVGFLCSNLEKSLEFYCGVLGLELNPERPEKKLPYRGAWLWVGPGMIHLMELPNPDPLTGRPEHGGRDRHACVTIKDVSKLQAALDSAGIVYTASKSGRPALFTRDPDGNALEFAEPM
ncbi:uncharacterized protein LOC9655665 isoform X1 [Selaginella moellendorffii]|uniref:uncharacterized protein LOC9655665 isoform X1 n=1 Tax=Selaginella moellendorffii TaxID=88036 RepID=UPI000D1CADD3|nr:uncharacterized protein LOC9655665 isoform X1 [Selaginella moellendorffii]|eukprot:XP_002964075.2 uncharacterized protein LOC9655665 isoform X1 [Selaginella moellendorffii]